MSAELREVGKKGERDKGKKVSVCLPSNQDGSTLQGFALAFPIPLENASRTLELPMAAATADSPRQPLDEHLPHL